ncbi:RNA-directed DNA polymerase, eukaryota, reverse transcriptase zinc-binding domain protein, partial [Tanacetum coccineum]
LNNLLIDIGSLNVEVNRDCVVSSLSTDGSYSVNIFMWRLLLDRLPHRLNLSSRGLDIDSILCPVCSEHVESNSHVFFSCSVAFNIWRLVRGWCDLKIPTLSTCDEWDIWTTMIKEGFNEEEIRLNLDLLTERRELAAIREARYKTKLEQYYNKKVHLTSFKPGEFVFQKNEASRVEDQVELNKTKYKQEYEKLSLLPVGWERGSAKCLGDGRS